jgi:ABC-2 type transport system permease protein
MHTVLAVTKKELRAYFNSPIAYILLAAFAIVSGWLFFLTFFLTDYASVRNLFAWWPLLFILLVPAISMRLWAEERKAGTDELLLTMPLTHTGIVTGKFLAALALLLAALLATLPIPIIVASLGNLDWGPVIGGYLGSLLLGGAYLSLGLVVSSFTENQVVALIVSAIACFLLWVMGEDLALQALPQSVATFLKEASLAARFDNIERGVVDSRDVVYYASFIGFFLSVNVVTLKVRTWK